MTRRQSPWAASRNAAGVVMVTNTSSREAVDLKVTLIHEFHAATNRVGSLGPGSTVAFVAPPGRVTVKVSWSRGRWRRSRWSHKLG